MSYSTTLTPPLGSDPPGSSYSKLDDDITKRVIPSLEKCLDKARKADGTVYGNNSGARR